MGTRLREIVEHMRTLELQLEHEWHVARDKWGYRFDARRVRFDPAVRERHRQLKRSILQFLRESDPLHFLTAPVIYSLLLPFALLDLWVSGYQLICFRVYGIARVDRRRFMAMDRHQLAYLNGIEKVHCTYCSYVNGVIGYTREVAARTEQYWCPIKHARRFEGPHARYGAFPDYGDAQGYRSTLPALRKSLREESDDRRGTGAA